MNLTLKIWRQPDAASEGAMHTYEVEDISEDMSFLEMLDVLNERLNGEDEEPIAFDSDCREGICGMCGLMVNGEAHGPEVTTTCQLHMRSFKDGETITIEPWRADAFPVIRDLCVDRRAFDRLIQQGGYISVNTGAAPDAHATPVPKDNADRAFDAATCIGCGACVAACPNGSASLFVGAKITHLGELMCIDALNRRESCGGHFRAESQTEEHEALRHDDQYAYVAAWEWAGQDEKPILHKEELTYEYVEMKQRSYK